MRALLAFDKFKGSLTAAEACAAVAGALRDRHPDWVIDSCPLADGGDGFAEILTRAAGGTLHHLTVGGPRGEKVSAQFGLVPAARVPPAARPLIGLAPPTGAGDIAVLELAQASGLARLAPLQRDPWLTSTGGIGELIQAAASRGVQAIILGVGGSATNDLGLGALEALGLKFFAESGERLSPPTPATWAGVARIGGHVHTLPPLWVACDVDNPLLGRHGAATVFGPQKGLRAEDLRRLEHLSARVAMMLGARCRQPDSLMDLACTGAAGGTAFGLRCAAGARLVPGSALVAAWLNLDARIAASDVILTGEGCFDAGSLAGKGPGMVVSRALAAGKAVSIFAGANQAASLPPGADLHLITPAGMPVAEAMRDAAANLAQTVRAAFA